MAAQSDLRFTFTAGSDIAAAVLKKHALTLDYELRATHPHETREYCVQGPMTKSAGGAGNSLTLTGSSVEGEDAKCTGTK